MESEKEKKLGDVIITISVVDHVTNSEKENEPRSM